MYRNEYFDEDSSYYSNYSKICEGIYFFKMPYSSEENKSFENILDSYLPNFAKEEVDAKALMTNEHISINPTKATDKEKSTKKRIEIYFFDLIIDILKLFLSERDIKKILDKKGNIEHLYQYRFICNLKKKKKFRK